MKMNIPQLRQNVPLAPYTTFKIGGPAKYFVAASTKQELINAVQQARQAGIAWTILGGGSNVLIADSGFDGLVIKTELRAIEIDVASAQVRAEAGALLSAVIVKALQQSLAGLEFATGVPATVGGAVWANLGARGQAIQDLLIKTFVIDENGLERVLKAADCQFAYRDSIFKHKKYTIVDVLFQLQKGNQKQIKQSIYDLNQLRVKTQDVGAKSAGSIFRNPVEQTVIPAAKLIDQLGLKGMQIGGAQISPKHANFIINTGGATAADVVMLISLIKQKVRDKHGIQLREEIEYIGF